MPQPQQLRIRSKRIIFQQQLSSLPKPLQPHKSNSNSKQQQLLFPLPVVIPLL